MKRNHLILVAISISLLILFGALAFLTSFSTDNNASNPSIKNVTLNVSSEGPIDVKWMESLGNKYVFVSQDAFVVMDKSDSDKIPSIYACDVMFNEIFSCDILENHTLGNVKYPKDVLYVENVKYIREEAIYFEV